MSSAHRATGSSKRTRKRAQPHSFRGSSEIRTTVSHHPSRLESAQRSGRVNCTYRDHGSARQEAEAPGAPRPRRRIVHGSISLTAHGTVRADAFAAVSTGGAATGGGRSEPSVPGLIRQTRRKNVTIHYPAAGG